MPQQASWNNADQAPEYPPAAGSKTSTDTRPAVETPTEARQAVTGHGARYVLLISTAAVVVAFAIIYAVFLA
jgi:hypothetical protein